MSTSSSESEYDNENDILDYSTDEENNETFDYGTNGFSFEPEHSEEVVQALLSQHNQEQPEDQPGQPSDDDVPPTLDDWCNCQNCKEMENNFECECCRQNAEQIIGDKFGVERCISHTDAFQDVCLNVNVLQAALGTWRTFTDDDYNHY